MTPEMSPSKFYSDLYDNGYISHGTVAHKLCANMIPAMKDAGVQTVLDVGCGRGHLLRAYSAAGFTVLGTEIAIPVIKDSDFEIFPGYISDITDDIIENADFIVLCDVLNHIGFSETFKAYELMQKSKIGGAVAIDINSEYQMHKAEFDDWRKALTGFVNIRGERIKGSTIAFWWGI